MYSLLGIRGVSVGGGGGVPMNSSSLCVVQPTKTKESATTSLSACWVILGVSIICQTLAQTAGSLKGVYIDLFVCVDMETSVSGLIQRIFVESARNLTGIISERVQSLANKEGLPIRLVTMLHHA